MWELNASAELWNGVRLWLWWSEGICKAGFVAAGDFIKWADVAGEQKKEKDKLWKKQALL